MLCDIKRSNGFIPGTVGGDEPYHSPAFVEKDRGTVRAHAERPGAVLAIYFYDFHLG